MQLNDISIWPFAKEKREAWPEHQVTSMMDGTIRIVVPVNGTATDERTIRVAAHYAAKSPVVLTLVHVVEVMQSMPLDAELPRDVDRGETILRNAETYARQLIDGKQHEINTELLQARSAGAAIVDEAIEQNASALVMGARLRVKYGKATLGETVNYVLKSAPCEVILLRQPLQERVAEPFGVRERLLSSNGSATTREGQRAT